MPIYEYRCKKCGDFEATQRITDPPLDRCPTCKGKISKLISNTSFHLKGTGWYVTDYGRKGNGSTESSKPSEKETETSKSSSSPKESSSAESSSKEASATTPSSTAASK